MAFNTPERRGPGAPTKFNQDRAERLLQAVRAGNYLTVACKFAEIDYSTLRRWLLKADDLDAPEEYREFKRSLEMARGSSEVAALAKIQKAASEGHWQAAAWFLERSAPDRWGRRDRSQVEIMGEGGGPVRVVGGMELNNDHMAALAARLAGRAIQQEAEDIVDAELVEEEVPRDPRALPMPEMPEPPEEGLRDWNEDE
jgi:hypothetical protein